MLYVGFGLFFCVVCVCVHVALCVYGCWRWGVLCCVCVFMLVCLVGVVCLDAVYVAFGVLYG